MKLVHFNFLTFIVLLSLLIGCTSSPLKETNYYLLNNQQVNASLARAAESTQQRTEAVLVNLSELSEYLNQPYLVMQLADHQLHYARFHMWAEPLHDGISKAVINDLNGEDINRQFVMADASVNSALPLLTISIESFHATSQSKVILSGKYWLTNKVELAKGAISEVRHPFYFETRLDKDGYDHSVAKMRMLISELSVEISKMLASEKKSS